MDHIRPDDLPLHSDDLAICQRVLDAVCRENGIERGSPGSDFLAWRVIGYYRRGLYNEGKLLDLVRNSTAMVEFPRIG